MRSTLGLVFAGVALAVLWPAAPAAADGIRDDQWHLTSLGVADAQARTRGGGVVVAVVDQGVDATHPDLSASVLAPVSVDLTAPRADPNGHGTALAGVIAGQGHGPEHGDGVLGVAPDAKVLPVVITVAADGSVTADQLAAGIDLAVSKGAKVVCVGYTVPGNDRLNQAVLAANRAGVIVVAADGNRAGETVAPFPASYEGVLSAIPLGRDGTVLVSSTSGRKLGFGVPGEDIMTTNIDGGYRIDAGNAAPGILAGAVALVRAAYPDLPPDEIVHRLSVTALDAGARGPDEEYGQGKLDLVAALTRSILPLHAATPSPAPSRSPQAVPVVNTVAPRGIGGWLLLLPLAAVLGAMIAVAIRAERRTPTYRPHESGKATLDPEV